MSNIYLGRFGRAFGPYSDAELKAFEASGELKNFNWIWNHPGKRWDPLDAAPAPLDLGNDRDAKENVRQLKPTAFRHDSLLPLEVVCHNGRHAITGALRNVVNESCELVSANPAADTTFAVPSKVILSLYDPKSGSSYDVSAELQRVNRKDGRWNYTILWDKIPELVRDSLAT